MVKFGLTEAPVFGKYRLIAKLGQGGMADVFLAVSRGPGGFAKLVVIKRLKSDVAAEKELHGMFVDEARLAARLNHPNVVQTNEVGNVGEHFYLCMEYLEGQPLNRILNRLTQRGKKAIPEGLRILCDSLAGLHYAHELKDYDGTPLKVVHRDVSPHNIYVTYDGAAKVLDFGIAKAAVRSAHTSTGVIKGKIGYMAPEQALTTPIDARADVFSIGAILFELVSGERLWAGLTEVQILQNLAFGEIPRLSSKMPDVPRALDLICARALSMVPGDRYPSAAAFREALEGYMKEEGIAVSSADVGRFLSDLFQDRRDEVQEVIQQQLANMEADGDAPPRDVSIPEISVTGSAVAALPEQRGAVEGVTASAAAADPAPARPRAPKADASSSASGIIATAEPRSAPRRRRGPAIAAGAILALAAGLLIFVFGRSTAPPADAKAELGKPPPVNAGGPPPPPPPPAPPPRPPPTHSPTSPVLRLPPTAQTPPPPTAPMCRSPPPAPPADPAPHAGARGLIELRVEATPRDATIYLDDAALSGNPFSAKFAGDGTGHRLRVEAAGHKPESRLVVFDQDRSVEIHLDKPAGGGDGAAPSAAAGAAARPTSTASPPIRRGPKVDTSDPWK